MFETYAPESYYRDVYGGSTIPEDELQMRLKQAARNIDTLTYNRIMATGINSLSLYQQETIRECCCELAEFYYDNADMIETVLQSYSINGVSMSFGNSWNVTVKNGVAINTRTYAKLKTTGLCNRTI